MIITIQNLFTEGIRSSLRFKTGCKLLQRVFLIGIKTFLTILGFENSSYCHVFQQMFLFSAQKKSVVKRGQKYSEEKKTQQP